MQGIVKSRVDSQIVSFSVPSGGWIPRRLHDLLRIAKQFEIGAGVAIQPSITTMPNEPLLDIPDFRFIGKINTASIPTRYPDDLQRALKEYPKSVSKDYLNQTTELVQWLKQHPNLSK